MNKIYAAFLIFLSYFIVTTFIPKNADSASKQSTAKVSEKSGIIETALFAGGCFWCMEHPYENQPGISKALSGYTGGKKQNPTYNQVASGSTQHVEAVEIHFDPEVISYNDLLQIFWRNVDPTDAGGQFVDRGKQYTTGIFYKNNQQKKSAEQSKKRLEGKNLFNKKIITKIVPAGKFYPAEEYHQDFFKKNYIRYRVYRAGSGRDEFIKRIWGEDREYKISKTVFNGVTVPKIIYIGNKTKTKSHLTNM